MRKLIKILGDRKLGFILGKIAVLGLILGSIIMNFNAKLYPPFFPFDLGFFFNPVMPVHFWLYLLILIFAVFGINLFCSTLDLTLEMLAKRKSQTEQGSGEQNSQEEDQKTFFQRKRTQKMLSAILVHLSILLMMFAHLFEGFYSESNQVYIGQNPIPGTDISLVPGIGKARLNFLQNTKYPDGSRKDTIIEAEFDLGDGNFIKKSMSYNNPATFDLGRKEVIIQSGKKQVIGLMIKDKNNKEYPLKLNERVKIPEGEIIFTKAFETRDGLDVAHLLYLPKNGKPVDHYLLTNMKESRHKSLSLENNTYQLVNIIQGNILLALIRVNPSIPLSFIAMLVMLAGIYYLITGNRQRKKNENSPS